MLIRLATDDDIPGIAEVLVAIHTLRENRIGRAFYDRQGGTVVAEDVWNEFPAVWYAWDLPPL